MYFSCFHSYVTRILLIMKCRRNSSLVGWALANQSHHINTNRPSHPKERPTLHPSLVGWALAHQLTKITALYLLKKHFFYHCHCFINFSLSQSRMHQKHHFHTNLSGTNQATSFPSFLVGNPALALSLYFVAILLRVHYLLLAKPKTCLITLTVLSTSI